MSTGFAIALLLGLQALLLAPLVLVWFRSKLLQSVLVAYCVGILALGLHQTGLIRNDLPAGLNAIDLGRRSLGSSQCAEIIEALKSAGAVSPDSQPGRVKIRAERWQQIPENIKEALTPCLESEAPNRI